MLREIGSTHAYGSVRDAGRIEKITRTKTGRDASIVTILGMLQQGSIQYCRCSGMVLASKCFEEARDLRWEISAVHLFGSPLVLSTTAAQDKQAVDEQPLCSSRIERSAIMSALARP